MKQYKEGDKVVLDFSKCNPHSDVTPGGLYFPNIWRKYLQGKIITIDMAYTSMNSYKRYRIEETFEDVGWIPLCIDEFCILDPRSVLIQAGWRS